MGIGYAEIWNRFLSPSYERLRGKRTPFLEMVLERTQWHDAESLAARQWRELAALLEYAREQVPFYRDWFAAGHASPAEICAARDLSPLPIVGKAELMADPERYRAGRPPAGSFAKATGGSTGRPLRFLMDRGSDQWRRAATRRGYGWAGCRPGVRQFYFWGIDLLPVAWAPRLKASLDHLLQRQRFFSCFDVSPARLNEALADIDRWRPACLVGYTSALALLARHALGRGWRPRRPLKAVLTGAEALFDSQRAWIEQAFGAPVFETYGCREFMLIAAECPAHDGLHVSAENLMVELLADGRPAAPGQAGEVVITDLHNLAQPFIRYRTGDLAVARQGACACGRGLPRLGKIQGRILDVIRGPGGRLLPGEFFPHFFKDFPAVVSFQVEQDRVDHILARLVLAGELSAADRELIARTIGESLPGVTVDLVEVDDIPATAAGKRRVTIGLAPEEFR